jgi:hypothetical protein
VNDTISVNTTMDGILVSPAKWVGARGKRQETRDRRQGTRNKEQEGHWINIKRQQF